MRILQISSSRTYGGGERHFADLCRELRARGHAVFAALRPTNLWQDRLDFLERSNIFHVSIRNSFGILSANRIAGFIRENGIEIVHAHVARDYIPASIASALAGGSKFVLTRHVLFPLKPFNRFALKNLSMAIAVSSGVGTSLLRVFPPHKIAVIPNGIGSDDVSDEARTALGAEFRSLHNIPSDAPLIGIVGELIVLKGQRDFVLMANELLKAHPEARFVIAGKDNSLDGGFRRELRRLVKVFGLEANFLWLDWVDDTAPLFSALDIFVSASHTESFGLAMLEAMASGTVVVATATDGAKEIISNHELLVPVQDPLALADKLSMLIEEPLKRMRFAAEAEESARTNFSLNRMVDETEKVYMKLLAG